MSIEALTWVLEHSPAEHSDRLVLISLANHASADGTGAWPSIGTIAREAQLGESTVRGALERLKARAAITETGLGPRRTRAFRVNLNPRRICTPAESAPPQNLHPRRIERQTPQNLEGQGAESAPEPSLTVQEPSRPPRPPASGGRRRDWDRFAEKRNAWAAEHFPGVDVGYVQHAISQARALGQEPTVDELRPLVEQWASTKATP